MSKHAKIRWLIRQDMKSVLAIENHCFPDFPWSEEDFTGLLRQRNCIGMVVEQCEEVLGYFVYELNKDHLRILNFAVHEECQRQGLGELMVGKLASKLSPQRRKKLVLEVRETNLGAQLFFRKMGFLATRTLRGFYEDTDDDAYQMEYTIGGAVAGLESEDEAVPEASKNW